MPNVCSIGRQSASSDGMNGGRAAAACRPSGVSSRPRRRNQPMMQRMKLPMNGMRQPQAATSSGASSACTSPRRPRAEDESECRAGRSRTADETACRCGGGFGRVDHRARELATDRETLDQSQEHEQQRRRDADRRVGRQQADQERRHAHHRDRQHEQRTASDTITDPAEHQAADRDARRSRAQRPQTRAAVARPGSIAGRTVGR